MFCPIPEKSRFPSFRFGIGFLGFAKSEITSMTTVYKKSTGTFPTTLSYTAIQASFSWNLISFSVTYIFVFTLFVCYNVDTQSKYALAVNRGDSLSISGRIRILTSLTIGLMNALAHSICILSSQSSSELFMAGLGISWLTMMSANSSSFAPNSFM